MSITYPQWSLTTYPDALDKDNAKIRKDIVNFEDRTSSTDPLLYYILSGDVKALQEAVFSIQEVLGVIPQSTFGSISLRIAALEDHTDLDTRYGGATWNSLEPSLRPTIMGHIHDGSSTGAPKINLATHTTGQLGKANINLKRTDVAGITGADIAVSATTDKTIPTVLDEKLDKSGGTIQGTNAFLAVEGPFNSRIYKEADAYLCIPSSNATGANIADAESFSGTARRAVSTNAAGNIIYYTSQLRYGDYSLGIRARVSSTQPLQAIGKVRIYSGTVLVKEVDIVPAMFTSTQYQMFHVAFSHKGSKSVSVYIYWNGTSIQPPVACDLTVESLTITPMHLTTYDLD